MNLRPLLLVTSFTALLSGCIVNVNGASFDSFDYHRQQQLRIDANQLNALVAETGAGSLVIQGVEGLNEIQLDAEIYGYDDVKPELMLTKEGDHAKLIANFDSFSRVSFNGSSPYLDITMKVPASMLLDIDDGSGSIDIKGVHADINIKDGSGGIVLDGGNNLVIDDGSGSIVLANVDGNINLEGGSGAIEINQVSGYVVVHDGSGSMSIKNVLGKVTIDDGSGDIRVENSKGLHIVESGSGDLSFDNINGPVSMD